MAADLPPSYYLDLTRLSRRVDRGTLTGIDRVELAWARHLLTQPDPIFALVRSTLGFFLLDRRAIEALTRWAEGTPIPQAPDTLGILRTIRGQNHRAEAALSQLARARTHRLGLARLLRRYLKPGTVYLNTGHANWHRRSLSACRSLGPVVALIHDTIPLDLPQTQRPGAAKAFEKKLKLISSYATQLFYVSAASQNAAELHLRRFGRVPPGRAAPITIEPPQPSTNDLPAGLPPTSPYFVALGTIEPRKDHALLLDVWEQLARAAEPNTEPAQQKPTPELLIIGRRGWQNHAVFQRLDAIRSQPNAKVRELAGLSDAAVAALLQGARALLMPSQAEGFGLPLHEAMALGTPILACDLEAYKETIGDYAVYLPKGERYPWRATVEAMVADPQVGVKPARPPAPWQQHFNAVLSAFS